jgi:molecular chaperone HscA
VEASVSVKPSYGLSDDEIARMLQESIGAAEEDMRARALREQQVEAQRLIEATQTALRTDADLLSNEERSAIDTLMQRLGESAAGDDTAAIKAAIDELARGTDEFAARRMDRSIRTALAGRRIDEVATK